MLRIRERAEDMAAPTVPDDIANAPDKKECVRYWFGGERFTPCYAMDPQDVFLPRLGPDTWMDGGLMDVVNGRVQKEG